MYDYKILYNMWLQRKKAGPYPEVELRGARHAVVQVPRTGPLAEQVYQSKPDEGEITYGVIDDRVTKYDKYRA